MTFNIPRQIKQRLRCLPRSVSVLGLSLVSLVPHGPLSTESTLNTAGCAPKTKGKERNCRT